MYCPSCGHEAIEDQKFCKDCGGSLKGVTEATEALVVTPTPDPPIDVLNLGELPTQQITPRDEIPDPDWATPTEAVTPAAAAEVFDDLTTPTPAHPAPAVEPTASPPIEEMATTQISMPDGAAAYDMPAADTTTTMGAVEGEPTGVVGGTGNTDEMPEVFDGSGDINEHPRGRDEFKLKLVFVLAFFGAISVLMAAVADIIDIRTTVPVNGIAIGVRTLDTLGTNLAIAGFFGATVMALGGLLACFGFRWGAGLAGGAGLALVGWAGLVVGLAELRIAGAEATTRTTTDVSFTLRVTRDLGFWLIVAVAVIGLLVFLASLRSFATGGQPPLNPWVAALGAVAGVVLVAGPLLPVGNATFNNNFQSAATDFDLPTAYFGGRLMQLGLIAFAVVFGLLIVRAYGLGLAAGSISVALWLWITSLADMGSFPLGIAAGNFGAGNTTPHAVTSVGMALTLLMLLVAAILATVNHQRTNRY